MLSIKRISLAILFAAMAGCATTNEMSQSIGRHETCYVCRHNNDLACVDLEVSDSTPTAEYNGKTYYFCSKGCRASFLKNPAKYLPREGEKK